MAAQVTGAGCLNAAGSIKAVSLKLRTGRADAAPQAVFPIHREMRAATVFFVSRHPTQSRHASATSSHPCASAARSVA